MAINRGRVDKGSIISTEETVLEQLCPDLPRWPTLWSVEQADLAIGQRIVEAIKPFLIDLLEQGLAHKTLVRHRDHLCMLGGEIIRRRYDDPDFAKSPVEALLFDLLEEEGGPLIWPRITESAQNSFDATCRKLYRFLSTQQTRD